MKNNCDFAVDVTSNSTFDARSMSRMHMIRCTHSNLEMTPSCIWSQILKSQLVHLLKKASQNRSYNSFRGFLHIPARFAVCSLLTLIMSSDNSSVDVSEPEHQGKTEPTTPNKKPTPTSLEDDLKTSSTPNKDKDESKINEHIVLMGDSILDNKAYVRKYICVKEQLLTKVDCKTTRVTLTATDGAYTSHVIKHQIHRKLIMDPTGFILPFRSFTHFLCVWTVPVFSVLLVMVCRTLLSNSPHAF